MKLNSPTLLRRPRQFVMAAVLLLASQLLLVSGPLAPASAYPASTVTFRGHGWGHGRGLSQYGSLGYAVNHGWTSDQILDHYYSNTHAAAIGFPNISVRLMAEDAVPDFVVYSANNFHVNDRLFAGGTAVNIKRVGVNQFRLYQTAGCGNPNWVDLGDVRTGPVVAYPPTLSPGNNPDSMIVRCTAAGNRWYRGTLIAHEDNGAARKVNDVAMEDYLRGVVPRESPASWGNQPNGIQALKAQAVAARSYAYSENRYAYAKTCDTISCQVYGGAFLNGVSVEAANTDTAVAQTAQLVRQFNSSSSIARTEFSSSSGGWTTGGTFPAVQDLGDSIASNPNYNWSAEVPVSTIQNKYPQIGTLVDVRVNSRNGLGDMGGRATSITIRGSNGSVNVSGGDSIRNALGLKSDWFMVLPVGSFTSMAATNNGRGYVIARTDGSAWAFGNAVDRGSPSPVPWSPIVSVAMTPDNGGYWQLGADGGIFSFGNAGPHGSAYGRIGSPAVGLARTPDGGGYWIALQDGGIFPAGNAVGWGSAYGRIGSPVVGIAPTPTGNGYWLALADGGIFPSGDAIGWGSAYGRIASPVVGIASTPDGGGFWMALADGGVFTAGNARGWGSAYGKIGSPVKGITATPDGGGFWLLLADGGIFPYGNAVGWGSAA